MSKQSAPISSNRAAQLRSGIKTTGMSLHALIEEKYVQKRLTGPPIIMTKRKSRRETRNENHKNLSLCCQCNSGIKSFFKREKGAGSVAREAAEAKQKESSTDA
jgi:hypothetical protein